MNEKAKSEKTQAQILRDAFEGMKGRQPKSDQELKEWLATDDGKMATMFGSTGLSAYGVPTMTAGVNSRCRSETVIASRFCSMCLQRP